MASLESRSSSANTLRYKLPAAHKETILTPRRCSRMAARLIAKMLELSRSTVAALLNLHQMGQFKFLVPKERVRHYERATPGDLLHVDINNPTVGHRITGNRRLNSRSAGWEFVHVCINDHSRLRTFRFHLAISGSAPLPGFEYCVKAGHQRKAVGA